MTLVATEEHDEVLYAPGGMVYNWVYGVASEMYFYMQREAPLNKRVNKTAGEPPVGTLLAETFSDVERLGPKDFQIRAGSRAHYTRYVVEGTPTIWAKSGRNALGEFVSIGEDEQTGMYLPANPGYGPGRRHQRVSGQAANNFIGRAYDATARFHPALRGVSME